MKTKIKSLLTLGFIVQALILSAGAQSGVLFTSLYSFTGGNDGAIPMAALVQGSDGFFYDTTFNGGTNGVGTVFKINSNGVLTSLYSFTNGNEGANPQAGLVQGSDGNFYGTTSLGGTNSAGTVFKISTNGALTSYMFTSVTGVYHGAEPVAGLVQGSDGNFYGTTEVGAASGCGTVFKISTNGALTNLYSFYGGNDGSEPVAGLAKDSNGFFYGTTSKGGTNGAGTVFKISTNGALTSLYSFTGGNDGYLPYAGLVPDGHGYFYGTTFYGGTNGAGIVFKISTNGALTSLYSFTGGNDGSRPNGLVQGSDGGFYGTTATGGTNGYGTVFKLTIAPQLTITYSSNRAIISWPPSVTGWTLQTNNNLSTGNWGNYPGQVVNNSITNSPPKGNLFFRLTQ